MGDKVSGSRFRRLTKIGWLSRRALPIAWARLRQAGDADRKGRARIAEEILEKHADIAEEAFRTLGELKGIALKVGQMLAYMDGALPEEYRAVYQAVFSRLLQAAPALPFASVARVVETELGRPVAEAFSSFEEKPFAAASIGQVHRATLPSGEAVAVKVQYPGVDKAIAADMKNVSLFHGMAAPFLGALGKGGMSRNHKEIIGEIRARLMEELDYTREAEMQMRFRALLANEPDVEIPRVFERFSTARVLTTELIVGRTFGEFISAASPDEKNRVGAVLQRVLFRSLFELKLFNADPHPGNYLFPPSGKVVLLDFGCVKVIPDWLADAMRRYFRAGVRATRTGAAADWAAFDDAICDALKLNRAEPVTYEIYRAFILYCLRPYLADAEFTFTPDYTGESIDRVLDGAKRAVFAKGKIPRIPDLPPIPADFTFLNRVQFGLYSVLAMLRARGNFHRLLPADLRET
ncbi:MAG: AarF/ABC1/UbiB kinase family protein [Deltaproteobacteria bacterium]|nr:AarF/ABC1/UbiB kinase family protein [Deltaproteobacteria bacterium]